MLIAKHKYIKQSIRLFWQNKNHFQAVKNLMKSCIEPFIMVINYTNFFSAIWWFKVKVVHISILKQIFNGLTRSNPPHPLSGTGKKVLWKAEIQVSCYFWSISLLMHQDPHSQIQKSQIFEDPDLQHWKGLFTQRNFFLAGVLLLKKMLFLICLNSNLIKLEEPYITARKNDFDPECCQVYHINPFISDLYFLPSVADAWHFGVDPDPAIFVTDLQDANKKRIFKESFSAYYFLKVHLHNFSKIKRQKEVTKQ